MNIEQQVRQQLTDKLQPQYLEVTNESGNHNVPAGSETHFKVVLVSEQFIDKPMLKCHRLVYSALADQLAGPVHALALHTYSPEQWNAQEITAPASPLCHGGDKQNLPTEPKPS